MKRRRRAVLGRSIRQAVRLRRTSRREVLEPRLVLDTSPPPILQWFEGSYNTIEQRVPDVFAAGYGSVLTPPPGRADSGNQSVGYDVYNRFDLGSPGDPTLYGTAAGMKAMIDAIHQTGDSYYSDLVWNHDGFEDQNTPGFAASGGYPGFVLSLNPSNNYAGYNDPFGDFHDPSDTSVTGMRLAGLIDIAQEKNYQFIRSPVGPNPMNLPEGTTPYNGRLANVPTPSNAQFYPDHNLTPVTFSDPATGQSSVSVYPFNNTDPMDGTPEPENALGYLMRYTQWMVQVMGVDGFRLDAAKNMPPWVLNYYDQSVFRASNRTALDGSQEPIFGFSEVYDSDKDLLQQYVNKTDNGPNTVGGDRDVLDFPLFFALQGNLSGNGYQNNWYDVVNASVATEDGYANNGSEGVSFVSSADNGPPELQNVAYAYTLTHPGNTIVYFNGHEFGPGRNFPQDGRGDALGGLYGDTITNLVNIRNTHPDGNYDQRYIDQNVLVYERDDSMLVGLSNRTDSGYDNRWVQTDFAPGTYLIDLTGLSANSSTNEDGNIHPLLQVGSGGWVDVNVPRNSDDNNFTGDGYVIYAPASPQGTLTVNGTSQILPGGTPTAATNGSTELSPIDVVTGNSFQIQLNTNAVNLLGNSALADPDADGDNALYKIDGGVDAAGTGFVDTNPGDVAYGFQQFATVHNPGFGSASGNGEYLQTINTANLSNGYHYIDVRAFRHRNPGEPPIFTDFKVTIYVDHSPTTTELVSFNDVTPGLNQNKLLTVEATDSRVNNVHVLFDLPAGLTDAQVLALVGSGNQANQTDRNLWTIEEDGLTSGNHVATVVSYQIDGTASIQRFTEDEFPALATSTIYGAGLGDLDFNGTTNAADVNLFGQVLGSDNQQFNPAADFNGDGQIDNSDLLMYYTALVAGGADAGTLAAYQQLLGPTAGGYTIKEGTNLTLSVNQPTGTAPALTFGWSLNNDGNFADAVGASPTVTWAQLAALGIDNEGTYPLTLQVSEGADTIQIPSLLTVLFVPPTLNISGPGEITEGQTYSLQLSAHEPGGDTITSWTVNWGDGTTQTYSGNPSSVTHVFQAPPNAVTISATATDEDGTYTANTLAVTVNDAPLTAGTASATVGTEGIASSQLTATFNDAYAAAPLSDFSGTINWGDNTSTSFTSLAVSGSNGVFTIGVNHQYTEEGTYAVTAVVNDAGGSATTITAMAQVADAPLDSSPTDLTPPQAAAGVAFGPLTVFHFTDENPAATVGDYTATVNTGDATLTSAADPQNVTIVPDAHGGFDVQLAYTYVAELVNATFSVFVADKGGATTTQSLATFSAAGSGVLLLDATARGALSLSGGASLTETGPVVVDSSSTAAVRISGHASLTASDFLLVGGLRQRGNAQVQPQPTHISAAVADPLAGLAVPTAGESPKAEILWGDASAQITPGTYSAIVILGHAHLTLAPGVYVISGWGLTVLGDASVTGTGVLICNERGAIVVGGKADVHLTPPSYLSPYGGIAIFQPGQNKAGLWLGGNATLDLGTGTLYAPAAAVRLGGNAHLNATLIVDRLSLDGNASLGAHVSPSPPHPWFWSGNGFTPPGQWETGRRESLARMDVFGNLGIVSGRDGLRAWFK